MILTKDNLLRHIREKRYVTPTTISEVFDTSTMIASAALSELAKEKQIAITNLKLSSSPFYYDQKQPEALEELGKTYLKDYDKEVFEMLKQNQVLNDASLNIQQRLAINRIGDFAVPLEITTEERNFKFWVWYLRDLKETEKQIKEALNPKPQPEAKTQNKPKAQIRSKPTPQPSPEIVAPSQSFTQSTAPTNPFEGPAGDAIESKSELFIENYFRQNYLRIENKNKTEKYIRYTTSLTVNKMKIVFDCIYYFKKPAEAEVLKYYTSSNKPKIVFVESAPKKLFKLAENVDNLTMVNI